MARDAPATGRIDVVGLGPAGIELITPEADALMTGADVVFLRTSRHPAAVGYPGAKTFDHHYERAGSTEEVYRAIVEDLVAEATDHRSWSVVYAVPGSPAVAERTVTLLQEHVAVSGGQVDVVVHPALSFLDLAMTRLGVDPLAAGYRLVDGESFAVQAAGERGPLLVAQCWNTAILSDIKLSVETPPADPVTVLHHLGMGDERIWTLAWDDLDRSFAPDHLTSLWVPHLAAPVAEQLVQLDELVHTLRLRCPWDREQTHGSLARHLLEESYEVLEAIDELAAIDGVAIDGAAIDGAAGNEEEAVAHLEEELGDLLFQVYFHATLAAEEGRFTLADVARGVHDKLVSRHPHVFGDVDAVTPDDVAGNWEALKMSEKNRSSVTEGIPVALPALSLAAKLQRKAVAVGMVLPNASDEAVRMREALAALEGAWAKGPVGVADGQGGPSHHAAEIGELLFAVVNVARMLGVDPETALRARTAHFRTSVEERG
jgi:tetrapyrrole methylase family protein / MazG family protein